MRKIIAIEEVSKAGEKTAQTSDKKTGQLFDGQWWTCMAEFNPDATAMHDLVINRFKEVGLGARAETEKLNGGGQITRIYAKIPAWQMDRDWCSVSNPEWL